MLQSPTHQMSLLHFPARTTVSCDLVPCSVFSQFMPDTMQKILLFLRRNLPHFEKSVSRHSPHISHGKFASYVSTALTQHAVQLQISLRPRLAFFQRSCGVQFSKTSKKCPKFQRTEKSRSGSSVFIRTRLSVHAQNRLYFMDIHCVITRSFISMVTNQTSPWCRSNSHPQELCSCRLEIDLWFCCQITASSMIHMYCTSLFVLSPWRTGGTSSPAWSAEAKFQRTLNCSCKL